MACREIGGVQLWDLTMRLVAVVVLAASVCYMGSASPTLNCSGRKELKGDEGYISDGPDNYLPSSHCEWLIDAGSPNKTIHLYFRSMSTECSFDFLFIYDGRSYSSPLIATLSGDSMPQPVTATSGYMLLYMYSDRNYMKHGFEANYRVYDCPWNCSNNGTCQNHTCRCYPGYYGDGCQHRFCVDNCKHGTCVPVSLAVKQCRCHRGYTGYACNVSTEDGVGAGQWYTLQPSGSGFKGRTSHTAVFMKDSDCLWVFGGFDLNNVLNDLSRYCFATNVWEVIPITSSWPEARSGHAMAAYADGFFVFGGVLANDSHCNDLWYFNVTSERWFLKAVNSSVRPQAITGHTLTTVDDWLYVIGGKTEDRVFIVDIYRINAVMADSWETVVIKGGNYPPKRLVGHTALFHKESNSLIVYGGYTQGSALFSDRTSQIHALSLTNSYWSELVNYNWPINTIPKQRAFHTAVIMGNYMVVYGGNTHDHTGLEICYNPRMYFYHLGCHIWLNHTYFTGPLSTKGRFGHAAIVARGNLMLIVGGYSGQVLDDLIAFKVQAAVASNPSSNASDHCENYILPKMCQDDPECVYCRKDNSSNTQSCIHHSRSSLCLDKKFQVTSDRCPGICPALHTCGACVSHGRGAVLSDSSSQPRIDIKECSWCVKEAQCQTRSDPMGTCGAANQTSSGVQGWWGGLSANLTTLLQCQKEDFPAGLHWIKYRTPVNLTFPDELSIQRSTTAMLGHGSVMKIESDFTYTARFVGFLHPLNASPPYGEKLTLFLGLSHASAMLYLSVDHTEARKDKVISMGRQYMHNTTQAYREGGREIFPHVGRGHKYFLDQTTEQNPRPPNSKESDAHNTEVTISWNGYLAPHTNLKQHVVTSEFLEPFSKGHCRQHYNCLGCLTDIQCSWCQVRRECILRNETSATCQLSDNNELVEEMDGLEEEQYFITSPSECPSCNNHVQCHTCAADPLCEWVVKNGHCTRRFRDHNIQNVSACHPPCHQRRDCSECIAETGECAWCENMQTCLPFSDYVTRYIYGQCTSWVDSVTQVTGCHNCSLHLNCHSCLAAFSCGWCGNDDNPMIGLCVDGDFTGPFKQESCSTLVAAKHNISTNESASWSYGRCPDVEECRLGLHNCHPNATCTNTYDAFSCSCNQGFNGNGKEYCERTCYHNCVHGSCSGFPDYVCSCDLGWTNASCDVSCECNNHSTCTLGIGLCDSCQHRTTGDHCQFCSVGSFGRPEDAEGCRPCECNRHGDSSRGECHNVTGECFCTHNTQGLHCDLCLPGYYGNPRNGGKCYLRCDYRTVVTNITSGGLGLYRGNGVEDRSNVYCLWILTVYPRLDVAPSGTERRQLIAFTVEGDLEIQCGHETIYVYDGIPDFINGSGTSPFRHLAAVCGINIGRDITVHALSGTITVYFEGNLMPPHTFSRGFNATYKSIECKKSCGGNEDESDCRLDGVCACPAGFTGPACEIELCPKNCSADKHQGVCDQVYGLCRCKAGFAGVGCDIHVSSSHPHIELLLDHSRLQQSIPTPLGRVGHTVVSCGNKRLYVFGGYHLDQGLLNDMWQYDTVGGTWTLMRNLASPQPRGRYFHAAACLASRKEIYVYGGFLQPLQGNATAQPTNEHWKFFIDSSVWSLVMLPPWMPPLVGHTLTNVGNGVLVLIGGFSSQIYFSNKVYMYDANKDYMAWQEYSPDKMEGAVPMGLYGHSAVFDSKSANIYIYGGYLFRSDRWHVSSELYTFDLFSLEWNMLHPQEYSDMEGRVFHAAVGNEEEMVVIGGQNTGGSYAMDLLVYRYLCNTWHRLQFSEFEVEQQTTAASGVSAALENKKIYVFGGFVGHTFGTLARLTLPDDICAVFKDSFICNNISGCQVCMKAVVDGQHENITTMCFSAGKRRPPGCNLPSSNSEDKQCNLLWHKRRNCYRYQTCSQCLSKYPQFKNAEQTCQWCTDCPKSKCIPIDQPCPPEPECTRMEHIQHVRDCLEYMCPASDCEKCSQQNSCLWTRHFIRSGSSDISRYFNKSPVYNWNCVSKSLRSPATTFESYPPGECPVRCHNHTTCKDCLSSSGVEGGSQMCAWSDALQECMPPAYLSLRCSFGECGYVKMGKEFTCAEKCHAQKQCSRCITTPECGWCAYGDMNGYGLCMTGGLLGSTFGSCRLGNITGDVEEQGTQANETEVMSSAVPPIWAFSKCPTENECTNGHHSCNPDTQECIDTLTSYLCQCKTGYIKTPIGTCEPVCHYGCVNGVCIQPDVCQCHFGWVGKNCSVECKCNKHSNCASITETNKCLKCENNTMGPQCQDCKPFFVGDPQEGEPCVPCREFCNNHTDTCVAGDTHEISLIPNSEFRIAKHRQSRGPTKGEAICLACEHNTTGPHCGECMDGHFRKQREPRTQGCMLCQCNGHGSTCNKETGENCVCHNNTETNCETKDGAACWQSQCAICKEYFQGTPTHGHQCYRLMQVDSEYCLDPDSQTECLHAPRALGPGRTVFYVVQPKYLNVDIRITIDITQGSSDVYFSNHESIFQVFVDPQTGMHTVNIDQLFRVDVKNLPPSNLSSRSRGRTSEGSSDSSSVDLYNFQHVTANSLNTYITLSRRNTILIVRNVQFRLVITLPENNHNLRISRFYIIIQSKGDNRREEDKTYGILYFRQDQPHIDLFVFFSVFFSCFFLFLALCVMLWKMKQAFDARRSRQMREREMENMASRPFAKVLALIEANDPMSGDIDTGLGLVYGGLNIGYGVMTGNVGSVGGILMPSFHNRRGKLSRPSLRTQLPSDPYRMHSFSPPRTQALSVVPIAVEPTGDGVAAVATVLFQLPGATQAPCHLCMGSTLTMRVVPPQVTHKPLQRRRASASTC